jgi:hypothetical protein
MNRHLLRLTVVVLVAASSGCVELCLLPCNICLGSLSGLSAADDARTLPEVQPALLAAQEAEAAQLPSR